MGNRARYHGAGLVSHIAAVLQEREVEREIVFTEADNQINSQSSVKFQTRSSTGRLPWCLGSFFS